MPEFDNTNRGALFVNDKGDNPNRPDYRGEINVDGKEFWISGWKKVYGNEPQKSLLSLSIQPKEENTGRNSESWKQAREKVKGKSESEPEQEPLNIDDIPF